MKLNKLILTMVVGMLVMSCNLDEDPPFLSSSNVFESLPNAQSTLDGVYGSLASYSYYGFAYHYVVNGTSGLFVSGKGKKNTHNDNLNMASLKPQSNAVDVERLWEDMYQTIGRANNLIENMTVIENPESNDDFGKNDVLGHAYFLRAFTYFNLVRLWGDIPLRLEAINLNNVHMAKSPAKDIYAQIIVDADLAKSLMFGQGNKREGYPSNLAASMLKAKLYMHLATADVSLQDPTMDAAAYWAAAYSEAQALYGNYSLDADYAALWGVDTGNNNDESIFEVQFNEIAPSNFAKLWTSSKATVGTTWGRLRMNPETYDLHYSKYPGDQRIDETFISTYIRQNNGSTFKSYPTDTKRNVFDFSFPFNYKYWMREVNNTTGVDNKNFKVYRYADLLLMLAEISNELQNGEQMGYVSEVLARVSQTPHADYSVGQAGFRMAIMREYRFELLGEGQDWFNNRRRGYQYFRDNIIIPHNTAPTFNTKVDVTLLDNDESVMLLPTPASEINTNLLINE